MKKQEGIQSLLCNRHFHMHLTQSVAVIFIRALDDLSNEKNGVYEQPKRVNQLNIYLSCERRNFCCR